MIGCILVYLSVERHWKSKSRAFKILGSGTFSSLASISASMSQKQMNDMISGLSKCLLLSSDIPSYVSTFPFHLAALSSVLKCHFIVLKSMSLPCLDRALRIAVAHNSRLLDVPTTMCPMSLFSRGSSTLLAVT
jgi:hypothetical protein